jgi:hypothetical protein
MQTQTKTKTPKKTLNNAEFVRDFMNYGSPIQQIWLMEAVNKYSEQCIGNKDELIALMEYGLISGEAWVAAAEEWQKRWNENYQ